MFFFSFSKDRDIIQYNSLMVTAIVAVAQDSPLKLVLDRYDRKRRRNRYHPNTVLKVVSLDDSSVSLIAQSPDLASMTLK